MTTPSTNFKVFNNQQYNNVTSNSVNTASLQVNGLVATNAKTNILTVAPSAIAWTMIHGTVDLNVSVGAFLPVLDADGGEITLPASSEVFSVEYFNVGADIIDGGTGLSVGFGEAGVVGFPALADQLVRLGTAVIANGATGGLVVGPRVLGNAQTFAGTGDGGAGNVTYTILGAPNNALIVGNGAGAVVPIGYSGTLGVTVRYKYRQA